MRKLKWVCITPGTYINFIYKGEKREAEFKGVDYGHNEQHPEPQFFLRCRALDRDGSERSFAINKIKNIAKIDMSW